MKHDCFQITQKVFIRDGSKILVMRDRKSGYGDLPGGRMSEAEFFGDWMDSVKRELSEELGDEISLEILPEPVFVHRHRVNDENFPCIIVAYQAKFLGGKIHMSDEHDFMDWVELESFAFDSLFSEHMLDAINYYKKKI